MCVLSAMAGIAHGQSSSAEWIDVPYVKQPSEGCGAASLAMVMEYWAQQQHRPASADSDVGLILKALYVPREHGIPSDSMQRYLAQHGYLAFAIQGRWSDLVEQIGKGRPVIVGLRPDGQRALHYVVIDGIDPKQNLITMNDPAVRKLLTEERAAFEKDWSATHNWMLLAVPAPASQTSSR